MEVKLSIISIIIGVIGVIIGIIGLYPLITVLKNYKTKRKIRLLLGIKEHNIMILTFPSFGICCPEHREQENNDILNEASEKRCFFHLTSNKTLQHNFRVYPTVSLAEVRSIGYLNSILNIIGITPEIESDAQERKDKTFTYDMISLGFDCFKTMEILRNNPFFDKTSDYKFNIIGLNNMYTMKSDVNWGIIMRLHNDEDKIRIICAGFNEWGTSGAAFCLENKYNEILKKIRKKYPLKSILKIPDFLCFILSHPETGDETADIMSIWMKDYKEDNKINKIC